MPPSVAHSVSTARFVLNFAIIDPFYNSPIQIDNFFQTGVEIEERQGGQQGAGGK